MLEEKDRRPQERKLEEKNRRPQERKYIKDRQER